MTRPSKESVYTKHSKPYAKCDIYTCLYISRHDHLIAFFRMFGAVEYILFSSWCVFVILM